MRDSRQTSGPRDPTRSVNLPRVAAVALAAAGVAFSLVLYTAHKALAADGRLGLRVCSAGSDCATVLTHPRAVLWGLPLAAWGVLYFLAMGAWLALIGLPRRRRAGDAPLPAAAAVGVAVSGFSIYWMGGVIGAWCPWCLATHVANFLMFGLIAGSWARGVASRSHARSGSQEAPGCSRTDGELPVGLAHPRINVRRVGIALGVLAGVGAVLIVLSADIREAHARRHFLLPGATGEIAKAWRTSPQRDIRLVGDELTLGDGRAANTLVMFTDLCCPYCRQVHESLGELADRVGGLRVVFKQFPFHPVCNPAVRVARRRYARSCQAAWAVQAVGTAAERETMAAFAAGVLSAEAPDGLDDEALLEISRRAGVDAESWSRAARSDAVRRRVDMDIAEGRRLGVRSVPAFFLDGRALRDAFILDADSGAVDWERTDKLWGELLRR